MYAAEKIDAWFLRSRGVAVTRPRLSNQASNQKQITHYVVDIYYQGTAPIIINDLVLATCSGYFIFDPLTPIFPLSMKFYYCSKFDATPTGVNSGLGGHIT